MTLTDVQIETLQGADLLVREAKAMYDNARLIREREIRLVAAEGGTYREIGEVAGVAYQRVAQIVTGDKPITRPQNDHLEHACPRCGADVGEACDGKLRFESHAERINVAYEAFAAKHPELG